MAALPDRRAIIPAISPSMASSAALRSLAEYPVSLRRASSSLTMSSVMASSSDWAVTRSESNATISASALAIAASLALMRSSAERIDPSKPWMFFSISAIRPLWPRSISFFSSSSSRSPSSFSASAFSLSLA